MIDMQTTVRLAEDVVSADLDGEIVLYNPESGEYEQLNDVGAALWHLLEQDAMLVGDMCTRMQEEYEVSPEQCQQDVVAFFNDLSAKSLIEITN
jgi:hypothetical protein